MVRWNGLRKGSDEKQPGDLVLDILLKVLCELGHGSFCWLFRDFLRAMKSHRRMFRREGPICCHLAMDGWGRDLGLGAQGGI